MTKVTKMLNSLAKLGDGGEFKSDNVEGNFGFIARLIKYGLAEKAGPGRYHLRSRNIKADYKRAAMRSRGNRYKQLDNNNNHPPRQSIKIMQLNDDSSLIAVGKRLFLAKEVALSTIPNRKDS